MWLTALRALRAAALASTLAQLCVVPGADAAVKPLKKRVSDEDFVRFLGFLATRYLPADGTLILCRAGEAARLPWVLGALHSLPVMALCPGADNQLPAGRLVAFMVVGTPQYLPQLMAQLSPAADSSRWYSEMMIIVRPDEDADDADTLEPLVQDLMAITWSRSWGQTSVTVVRGEVGTLYAMVPFTNASAVCGSEAPVVAPLASVRITDPAALATLPHKIYAGELVPRDLGGCVVRATVIVSYRDRCGYTAANELPFESRLVVAIMESVAQYRNVKVNWTYVTDQKIVNYGNGTFSDPLRRLNGQTDVVLGVMAMSPSRMQSFRATVSFLQTPIVVTARCPNPTPGRPRHLSKMFRNIWVRGVWGCLLVIGVAVTVVLRVVIARVSRVVPRTPRWWCSVVSAALLDHMAKMCEVVTPAWRMCPAVTSARVLTGTWLLVLLNINVAMKGLLLTEGTVTKPLVMPQTVPELLAAMPNVTVFTTTESLRASVNASGVPLERVVACESEQDVRRCEDRFAREPASAVASSPEPSRLKCLRGCRYSLPTVLVQANYVTYVRKTYVLVDVLDETILRLQNGGLIERLVQLEITKRRSKAKRSQLRQRRQDRTRRRSSFSVDHMIILLAGLAVATLAFLGETATHRLHAIMCPSTIPKKQLAMISSKR
ncbi:uncharacterized protein LOC117643471 [Thrips palmi]|uniref:Uncharacterized protein LOC117643471 n=1 Tax=Thrips palmi TaxID=161013 RepID=A0A6P8YEY4_THRPL|nr:uncharacterized protein LOC117643471 [Thrips palmi]